ncbi:MAG: hypothetical protein Q7U53_00995 [Anaerolineaceae bacterium]|nr:hypothetical protein [Anaerolineaceae bacterium]
MFTKVNNLLNSVIRTVDTRMIVFVIMLALLVIGAGAPGATGLNGG